MKRILIAILVILITGVIIFLVVSDFSSTKIVNRSANPYEIDMDEFKKVDPALIKFKETKQMMVLGTPKGFSVRNEYIYLLVDQQLQIINLNGELQHKIDLKNEAKSVDFIGDELIIGFKNYVARYSHDYKLIAKSDKQDSLAVFTSVATTDEFVFVADAGNRRILRYNHQLELMGEFFGESGDKKLHGFIVPSPYFDILTGKNNELWVVNPGTHAIQNYSPEGELIKQWQKISNMTDGFSGCCNPAYLTVLPNGNFITSEKKIVRVKEYSHSGELLSVVAAPEKFKVDGHAPGVVAIDDNTILALDFDKKLIRFFRRQ